MIFNLSAGDNTSEEVAILLTEFMNEVNNTLTSFKSEVNTMLTGFTNNVDSDITALNSSVTALSSSVATVKTDVATVKSNVSTLSTTVNGIPKGIVKSVQRGVIPAGTSTKTYENFSVYSGKPQGYYIDVTISAVSNINKCFVYSNVSSVTGSTGIPKLVNATTLRLYVNGDNGDFDTLLNYSAISWQVVEFY